MANVDADLRLNNAASDTMIISVIKFSTGGKFRATRAREGEVNTTNSI